MKQKAFFLIFKGLSLKQIKSFFLESGSAKLIRITSERELRNELLQKGDSINNRQTIGFILLCLAEGISFWSSF